ncbi:hypothetical protein [Niabella hibiscisoli]|uniref:hypothetical protein n=1 Tax=Niabella hibiscisoli TaxID=1825928 RepID=UPI001F0DAD24|nr:hypothetical protein [Niabella hibiscisoli]MCH5715590.1 hypothetical protein [Niabella hibiscisoli]
MRRYQSAERLYYEKNRENCSLFTDTAHRGVDAVWMWKRYQSEKDSSSETNPSVVKPEPEKITLLPNAAYRDTLPQGEGTLPFVATNNTFDFTGRIFNATSAYSPNLLMPPGIASVIAFTLEGGSKRPTASLAATNNNALSQLYEMGVEGGNIFVNTGGGNYTYHGPLGTSLLAFERTTGNSILYTKYTDGVRTVLYDMGRMSDTSAKLYPRFSSLEGGTKLKYLQSINTVVVNDAGNPLSQIFTFESYIDNAYYAANALNAGGQKCKNGDAVITIPDSKGNVSIKYNGASAPTLGIPKYLNGSIAVTNQSDAVYLSSEVAYNSSVSTTGLYNLPEEVTMVFRKMPGTDWEAISTTADYYIGFGGGALRVMSPAVFLPGTLPDINFKVAILHVRFYKSGSADAADVWLNGISLGTVTTSSGMYRSKNRSISVHTNASDHDLIAKFYKSGTISDRADYLKQLNTYFNANEGPLANQPYASNVTKSKSGNQYTANYVYNGLKPENASAVQYQWYELINNGAFTHVPLGTTKTITYTGPNAIRPTIKVVDSLGNSWRYVNGLYE